MSPDPTRAPLPLDTTLPSLSLVVPLYNEERRFTENADALVAFIGRYPDGSELIFVDDGSRDRTVSVVERYLAHVSGHVSAQVSGQVSGPAVRLVRRPHAGKGAAVRAGLEIARAEYAAFCDVDLATPLDDLDAIVVAARMTEGLAVGSRGVPTADLVLRERRLRELLGRAYNRLVQATLVPGISDTQCGAKAAPTALWRKILPYSTETGFAWDVEAIAIAQRLGFVVREVGVRWSHDERTSVRVGRDGAAMVLAVPRLIRRARRVSPVRASAAEDRAVFDDERQAALLDYDTSHWWYRSKAALVASVLARHSRSAPGEGVLVDIGAGSGGVTSRLGWRPDQLVALDGSGVLAAVGRERHGLHAVVAVGTDLPFADGSCQVVTLLDVIEHLARPEETLREVWRVLAPDGCLVVTVPAHQWLWTLADEVLGHYRRYTRRMLAREMQAAGFETRFVSHVFSWLVPPVWVRRRLLARDTAELGLDQSGRLLDWAALVLTGIERQVIKFVALPFGTSVVGAATKPRAPSASVQ